MYFICKMCGEKIDRVALRDHLNTDHRDMHYETLELSDDEMIDKCYTRMSEERGE